MTRCTVLRQRPFVQTSYKSPMFTTKASTSRRDRRPLPRLEQHLEPARVEGAHVIVILA